MHKNFDFNEIEMFNNYAIDGKFHPVFKLLNLMNPIRLSYILDKSNGLFGKKVLDVGCGIGILSESMAKEGAEVTGIDISKNSLEIAKLHSKKKGLKIKYIQDTVETYEKTCSSTYDVITCIEMLEHVPCPMSVVQTCAKLTKSKGSVFFSTLNRNFKSLVLSIICVEYFFHILPIGTHKINKFIKPSELLNWIDTTDLYEKNIIGLKFNPLRRTFFFSKNIDVNYILHTKRNI